ncbi:hypothetical protein TWF696_001540 [Orbilia brochopaga]|uniref:OTU domain-containing protein n=1 Tax=Orbilia brochopaga TaxID=3140254 RepID=A0AAV9UCJ0_9PEZI
MSDEHPLLAGQGLYAADIIGDGDCLFRSLSDQLYGSQSKAHEIRQRTTSYMRAHASYFKLFLSVASPRRKARATAAPPSEAAVDRAFEAHVDRMAKAGVYGDNLEIVAFARCYGVNVKIYRREYAYQISCDEDTSTTSTTTTGERALLHIAYHDWEHYSSIRNIDGPHTGLPAVSPREPTDEEKRRQKRALEDVRVEPWMEKVVVASLPAVVSGEKVRDMLVKCKADVGLAVSRLLDELSDAEDRDSPVVEDGDGTAVNNGDAVEKKVEEAAPAKNKGKAKGKTKDREDGHAKQPSRPKRETARERKDRLQREKMDRKKAKGKPPGEKTESNSVSEGIKTLHV